VTTSRGSPMIGPNGQRALCNWVIRRGASVTTRLRVHQIKTSMRTWMPSHLVIKFAQRVVVGKREKKLEAEAEERAVNTAVNLPTTSPVLKTLFF
jgi:hypothetical protein